MLLLSFQPHITRTCLATYENTSLMLSPVVVEVKKSLGRRSGLGVLEVAAL
jgi:hypothetical protein